MSRRKLVDEGKFTALPIAPLSRADTDTANSAALNQQAAGSQFREAVAILHTGAATGSPTAQDATLKLQDSANDSDWDDVTGKTVTSDADSEVKTFDWDPGAYRQYQRLVVTVSLTAGTSPELPCSAGAVLFGPARGPVA